MTDSYRADFQILEGDALIYFDNACQTLRPKQVLSAMNEYYEQYPACGGRSMHRLAARVSQQVDQARARIARFIDARDKKEIVFTRNTTEGINLVAHSLGLRAGDVVITSDKEHNSNLIPWQVLQQKLGIKHVIVATDQDGLLDLEAYQHALTQGVALVSMGYVSNLDGVAQPVERIIQLAHAAGAKVLLDGAQAVPHHKLSVTQLDVDFLAFSGHKMLGPSGIGVLYGKSQLLAELEPFLVGGDTVAFSTYTSHEFLAAPEKFEAGLQDYAGIIGLGAAVAYLEQVGFDAIVARELELNQFLTKELTTIKGLHLIGPQDPSLRSGIISFYVDGKDHHKIALMLDEVAGICVRSGQHCVHSWFHDRRLAGSVRASVYFYNTLAEAEVFVTQLRKVLSVL